MQKSKIVLARRTDAAAAVHDLRANLRPVHALDSASVGASNVIFLKMKLRVLVLSRMKMRS